jgi:hypothetical protein
MYQIDNRDVFLILFFKKILIHAYIYMIQKYSSLLEKKYKIFSPRHEIPPNFDVKKMCVK